MPVKSKLISLLSASFNLRPFTVLRLARYSRHPPASLYSAAAFHGRLHFFNRPKIGFCSAERNLFHSEAVFNEACGEAATSFSDSKNLNTWPEWAKFVEVLVDKGYLDRCVVSGDEDGDDDDDDSFSVEEDLQEEFLKAAGACLGFSRDRPDVLRLLAKKNVEAVVLNGSPFLFKNGENSTRRMKLYLSGEESSELECEKAQTVDVMRYIVSHVYGSLSLSDDKNLKSDELVERSVRKLLCELFNLSGTVWKPKSVDATLTELPLSNKQLSGNLGKYVETRSGDSIYPKIPVRSSAASENQPNASSNFTAREYEKSFFNHNQGTEETPSSQTGAGSFIANSAHSSTSVLYKNIESWNRVKTTSPSNAQKLNEPNAGYSFASSNQPPNLFGNSYNSYYGESFGKPTQPSGNLWSAESSPPPVNSWNEHRGNSYNGNNVNPNQQSSHPSNNSWNNYNASFAGYSANSAQPSSTSWSNSNTPYGGPTVKSSQPPASGSWSNYNTTSSTEPSINSRFNNNRSYGESSPNSSQPPSSYQSNYSTRYDGYGDTAQSELTSNSPQPPSNSWYSPQPSNNSWNNYNTPYAENAMKSTQPSSNYWNNNSASFGRPIANSSQPHSTSWNNHNTNSPNSTEPSAENAMKSTQPSSNYWNNNSASFGRPIANSSQQPSTSWNSHNTNSPNSIEPSAENAMKSTQPSSNYWNNNSASFGRPIANSSQSHSTSWNNHNTNSPNSTEPSASSRNCDNSYVGFNAESNRGFPANSIQPSNNSSTSYSGASANPPQPSSSTWNNIPGATNGLPSHGQTQNAGANLNYGYSGKSMEGSCVTEPDPLDMSEEAKAERWFRRAAQIKDISELSQIPDEDFPQIMPMRKGVNRFVVSKRKTPLERRLASQQYKRSLPVVSSEPEKETRDGEKEI